MDENLTVRRAPKYGVFLALGAAAGILAAMIVTFAFDGTGEVSSNTGLVYNQGQVFGFMLLIFIPLGLAVAGIVALVLDRTVGRRTRSVRVEHEVDRDSE